MPHSTEATISRSEARPCSGSRVAAKISRWSAKSAKLDTQQPADIGEALQQSSVHRFDEQPRRASSSADVERIGVRAPRRVGRQSQHRSNQGVGVPKKRANRASRKR